VLLQESGMPMLDESGSIVGFRGSRRVAREDAAARRELAAARGRVKDLLAAGALDVAFQPIVDLASGSWTGVEALSRFRDGRSPDVWFAEADSVGHGRELKLLALRSALVARGELPRHISVSINASPALIVSPEFTAVVDGDALESGGLVVEVTEHAQVTDYEAVNDALRPLRDRGLRVAVDDTGAGYASFSHVLRLRPDVIKIDRSLLTRLHLDAARGALVTAIVLLALELDATVVAEDVGDADELRAVRELGCDLVQGYHLARPETSAVVWHSWAHADWAARVDATRRAGAGVAQPRRAQSTADVAQRPA
jgi:EAL domain-containing protein (putative c-di-GMP-specific phosphodiesterase class I)